MVDRSGSHLSIKKKLPTLRQLSGVTTLHLGAGYRIQDTGYRIQGGWRDRWTGWWTGGQINSWTV